jgi:hypothetical protein
MLKLIPNEGPERVNRIRREQQKKITSVQEAVKGEQEKQGAISKIQQRIFYEISKDMRFVKSMCVKLVGFLKKEEESSVEEISEMINSLRRSIACLERQRARMMRKEKDKGSR